MSGSTRASGGRPDPPEPAQVLIPPARLQARVAELAADIAAAYADTDPIFVTVLKGGTVFLADLVRHVGIPLEIDFLAITPYAAVGTARIVKDLDLDISGRHVLVVEDIVDTGLTLAYLLQVLASRAPASLRVCTLLDRAVRRIADLPLDWVGFEVGDEFLVGYGLDLDGWLRQLPAVLTVRDRAVLARDVPGLVRHLLR
ncbi:MAG TPA: hypoxanthine phosphoribosyltransferase [Nitriliruptorales bacterium]|nr:hypoxanthine phosphoribosyltransferase [Nitriliruptorales bacterium]